MCDDNDETIVEPFDVQSLLDKYNSCQNSAPIAKGSIFELSSSDDDDCGIAKISLLERLQKFDDLKADDSPRNALFNDRILNDVISTSNKFKFKSTNSTSSLNKLVGSETSEDYKATLDDFETYDFNKKQDDFKTKRDDLEVNDLDATNCDVGLKRNKSDFKLRKSCFKTRSADFGRAAEEKRKSKELARFEKAELQLQKQRERERKKEEAERAKEIKRALSAANKNLKPEECVKFVTAFIDSEIMKNPYGSQVGTCLENLGAAYEFNAQIVPNSVTWTRKIQQTLMNECGKLSLSENFEEIDQMLLILDWREVVELVHKNALLSHIKNFQSIFENKRISLGIFGIEEYFKYAKKRNHNKKFENASIISRRSLEFALTELQLLCNCCHRFLETAEDVGGMISQFTKAIAQAPYKLEKQEKYNQAEWYMSGDNKDCVRVDKDGNGLRRLWQQQLTCFPLARLETAESIMSKFPTLVSLMHAYDECDENKTNMVQDIPIRRAAGPMANVRRLGPELSRRMGVFFNTLDGEQLL